MPRWLFHYLNRNEMRPPVQVLTHGSGKVLMNRLNAVAPADLPQEVDLLGKLVDYPLQLVNARDSLLPPTVLTGGLVDSLYHVQNAEGQRMIYLPLEKAGKMLVMGPLPEPPKPDSRGLVILIGLTLLVVAVTGLIIVVPVAKNLRVLETAATQFGEGVLESRADVKSRDAVGSVARRFNQMASSIEKMIQRERQLLQSVSHELRTPIARIRFSLDMLTSAESQQERTERAQEIDNEIAEIDQLVGELLDYNRYQSDALKLTRQSVDVRPVLEEVNKRLQDFRPEINMEVVSPTQDDCQVIADRLLFRRAVQNLVMNAIRFADSQVTIKYRREHEATIVEVEDDGPGVPKEQRDLIMKPFYRSGPVNGKGPGGAGLGLAIVNRILELHHGTIAVGEAAGKGASFSTRWPDSH